MDRPIFIPGAKQPQRFVTLGQMQAVIFKVCEVQPTDVELQLSILARALAISVKGRGITQRQFLRSMAKIYEETTGLELQATAQKAHATRPDLVGLTPPGPT